MKWYLLIIFLWLVHSIHGAAVRPRTETAGQGQSEYEKIELTTPIRLEPIIAIPYESTLKLIIHFRLPQLLGSDGEDLVASAVRTVLDEYRFRTVASGSQRFPVNSVLSKTSNYVVGTDQQIQSYVQMLGENDIPGFSVHSFNATVLDDHLQKTIASMMDQALKMSNNNAENKSSDAAPENTAIHFTTMLLTYIRGVAEACLNRDIPQELVTSYLQEKLLNFIIDHNFFDPSYKPSFSADKFEEIMDQAVSDCLLTDTRMFVIINIPLVRRLAKWQLFEAHHSKFVYDGKVCSVGGDSVSRFYAFDLNSENIIEIDDLSLDTTCKLNSSRNSTLCFIPPIKNVTDHKSTTKSSKTSVQPATDTGLSCTTGILNKLTLKELKDLCLFRCRSTHDGEHFVEELSPNTVVLTNVKKVKVVCPSYNFSRNFERIGSLKVHVQTSDCYLWADDEFFSLPSKAQSTTPNGKVEATAKRNAGTPVDISYLIPMTWTKNNAYSMYSEDNITFKIKNYKEIIDFEWLRKFEEEEDTREEEEEGYGAKHWNFFDDDYVE